MPNNLKNDVNDLTNRYISIDEEDCTYDAAGNLTLDHNGYQYTYDYENRITRIADSGGSVAYIYYDALGRRFQIFDAKSIIGANYYYNDQWQVLYKQGLVGCGSSVYVWGNYIDEALAMNTYYYAHDHLYSPAALTDSAGTVVERYEYDAYGSTQILTSNFSLLSSSAYGNTYAFTGRELDVLDDGNLKIMYYRNRYYSPETGRFMTQDPIGQYDVADKTLHFMNVPRYFMPLIQYYDSLNLYEYGRSNSLSRNDPFGLASENYKNCRDACDNENNWCGLRGIIVCGGAGTIGSPGIGFLCAIGYWKACSKQHDSCTSYCDDMENWNGNDDCRPTPPHWFDDPWPSPPSLDYPIILPPGGIPSADGFWTTLPI